MRKKLNSKAPPAAPQLPVLSPEDEQELDFHVCCCIEDIENFLSKNPTEKQRRLAETSLRILKNPSETFLKKKQVMRQWCGDYKTKFENKKKQIMVSLNEKNLSFKKPDKSHNSVFFKKHETKSVKDDSEENGNALSEKKSDSTFSFGFTV